MTRHRQMSAAEQLQRARELDQLRVERGLTQEERDEAYRLSGLIYMREWRKAQRMAEQRIQQRLISEGAPC